MTLKRVTLLCAALFLSPAACAGSPQPQGVQATPSEATAEFSAPAAAMARRGADGQPQAYPSRSEALIAGDTAGLLRALSNQTPAEKETDSYAAAFLAIDRIASDDFSAARRYLNVEDDASAEEAPGLHVWIDAWMLAMEGEAGRALERHRAVAGSMPGVTGELSLAAMLDALGRPEEALAVYEALTPSRIEAPEHAFDPRGIVFNHVRTVIVRHALLLQRLGRIEDAKAVYERLAAAEPEEATSYTAAIESLESGRNLDNEALTLRSGFAQALSDVSHAMQEERYIRAALIGVRLTGFDEDRAAFDLVALLIDPDNHNLRAAIVSALYAQAHYDGAAHVALSAPNQRPSLWMSGAQALLMSGDEAGAKTAIDEALKITGPDDRLQTLYGALQLRSLLGDREGSEAIIPEIIASAENPAELAAAHAIVSSAFGHFGELDRAVFHAREARRLDDTHSRRIRLADLLGQQGEITEALGLLRSERLARPDDPYTLNSLGYFLVTRTDRYEEAYRLLLRAHLLAENDPYISDSLGWALYKLGHLVPARDLIRFAREEMKPQMHWEVEDHLGDIYWHLGDQPAARESWARALENHPPALDRAEIETKLQEGLSGPAPETRPLPDVSLNEENVTRRGI